MRCFSSAQRDDIAGVLACAAHGQARSKGIEPWANIATEDVVCRQTLDGRHHLMSAQDKA
jgi:hypothetical protein